MTQKVKGIFHLSLPLQEEHKTSHVRIPIE